MITANEFSATEDLLHVPSAEGETRRPIERQAQPGPATDDEGKSIRLRVYARCCGTPLSAGFWDFNGAIWKTRLFAGPTIADEMVTKCPGCGTALFQRDEAHNAWAEILSLRDAEALCAAERERLCEQEGEFDERTLAALNIELGEGLTFDEAAVLYGRTPGQLRDELQRWLAGGHPQPRTP